MKKSNIIALAFTLLLVLWMLSGLLFSSDDDANTINQPSEQHELFKVSVERLEAKATPLYLNVHGQVEPMREVQVRAQTEGQIASIKAKEGETIERGEIIAHIAMNDRQLILDEQLALAESREKSLERLQALAKQNYQAASELDRAKADLSASEAAIARVRLDIEHTDIKAPFTGVLESILLEEGDFAQINTPIAVLLDQSPLIVRVNIAQQDLNRLSMGNKALVELATGETTEGLVRYISPRANAQTRTFALEIEIDNNDGRLKSGMSAKVQIETETTMAHFISPALFSLGSDGEVGVKAVDGDNIVQFYPVQILQSNAEGAWVAGLPNEVDVIVSGQGFVSQGSEVKPVSINDE